VAERYPPLPVFTLAFEFFVVRAKSDIAKNSTNWPEQGSSWLDFI
jgi:hypothetical protein